MSVANKKMMHKSVVWLAMCVCVLLPPSHFGKRPHGATFGSYLF
jgi:hypothetical protein